MEPNNPTSIESPDQDHLTKALNFQRMGMMASAQRELELARLADPSVVSDPRYQGFFAQQAQQNAENEAWKLPMRIAAGLLFADILVTVVLLLLNLVAGSFGEWAIWSVVHVGVDLYLAIVLLQLKDTARRITIWWAVIGLILGTLSALGASSWPDVIMQVCFSGSLLLLLAGKPSKVRAWLSVAVFVLGYLGTICGVFVFAFLGVAQ
jgi:hypothetical protein